MIRTIRAHVVYENKYVTIRDDDVVFPDGSEGTYFFSRWKAPYGVAVACVHDGSLLLLSNYRYADNTYSMEIPQGFGSSNSNPLEDARRELREETGIADADLVPFGVVGHDYKTYLFKCEMAERPPIVQTEKESTEDFDGWVWFSLSNLSLTALGDAGVFEPVTLAAALEIGRTMSR